MSAKWRILNIAPEKFVVQALACPAARDQFKRSRTG
jgi:hypothetical protein